MRSQGNCGSIPHTNHRPLPTVAPTKQPPKTQKRTYMPGFSTSNKNIPAQPRTCIECGHPIPQSKSESRARYQQKHYCSRTCANTRKAA